MDAFNTNYAYQMFCGCVINPLHPIRDKAFVCRVRKFLALYCDMQKLQQVLVRVWKNELPHKNILLMDATCYEVNIRFPIDVKLLWEQQIPIDPENRKIKLKIEKITTIFEKQIEQKNIYYTKSATLY